MTVQKPYTEEMTLVDFKWQEKEDIDSPVDWVDRPMQGLEEFINNSKERLITAKHNRIKRKIKIKKSRKLKRGRKTTLWIF